MAQSTLHFSFGMFIGSLYMVPRLYEKWRRSEPVSRVLGWWIVLSCVLGGYATLPALARRLSPSSEWISAWWANIFLFYPLIEKLNLPSIALGELCASSIFAAQYILILWATLRADKLAKSNG